MGSLVDGEISGLHWEPQMYGMRTPQKLWVGAVNTILYEASILCISWSYFLKLSSWTITFVLVDTTLYLITLVEESPFHHHQMASVFFIPIDFVDIGVTSWVLLGKELSIPIRLNLVKIENHLLHGPSSECSFGQKTISTSRRGVGFRSWRTCCRDYITTVLLEVAELLVASWPNFLSLYLGCATSSFLLAAAYNFRLVELEAFL